MKEVFKNASNSLTLEDCIGFYENLHISCTWNDGKDLTLEIERPLSPAAEKVLKKNNLI